MVDFTIKKNDEGYGVYTKTSTGKDGLYISFKREEDAIKFAKANGNYTAKKETAKAAAADDKVAAKSKE